MFISNMKNEIIPIDLYNDIKADIIRINPFMYDAKEQIGRRIMDNIMNDIIYEAENPK